MFRIGRKLSENTLTISKRLKAIFIHEMSTFIGISDYKEPHWCKDQNGVEHLVTKSNENFENYYASQKTCSSVDEWESCLAAMRRPLPQSFRFNCSRKTMSEQLKKHLNSIQAKAHLEAKPWCRDELIWQLKETSRWDIKENQDFRQINEFLIHENETGNISRQELVSMVPVLLLNIASHHNILDMCSSPGSKTKQAAELMMAGSDIPEGVLISNEFDPARCDRLSTNLQRMSCPSFILVNHDGQRFPEIFSRNEKTETLEPLRYDRIICDVPCSGDGTIRKNPTVWKDWNPGCGNARHFLQFNIVERGVELLKVGGVLAYSSCAINPIENEAVLSRLLSQSEGSLELVDCRGRLPGLNFAPGHVTWRVFDSEMTEHLSYNDVPDRFKSQLHPGMWPPPEDAGLHLDRGMRFLPHHNDDGGFFVAIIKKNRELPWRVKNRENDEKLELGNLSRRARWNFLGLTSKTKTLRKIAVPNRKNRVGNLWQPESYFSFLSEDDVTLAKVFDFYGFNLPSQFFYSSTESKKTIYLTSPLVKNILQSNSKDVNIVYAGAKVFIKESKPSSAVSHRIHPKAGSCPVLKFTKRIVHLDRNDLVRLLQTEESIPIADFSESSRQQLEALSSEAIGPCKVVLKEEENFLEFFAFIGKFSVLLYADQSQRYHGQLILSCKALS